MLICIRVNPRCKIFVKLIWTRSVRINHALWSQESSAKQIHGCNIPTEFVFSFSYLIRLNPFVTSRFLYLALWTYWLPFRGVSDYLFQYIIHRHSVFKVHSVSPDQTPLSRHLKFVSSDLGLHSFACQRPFHLLLNAFVFTTLAI